MDIQLAILSGLTFIIHLMGTLAYSARIAGVRTRRVALSFALFNVLVLISRTSNSFQGPFLAKRVEQSLLRNSTQSLVSDFRWLLLSAAGATLVGAFLIPTFQRLFSRAVLRFQQHRSVLRLFWDALSRSDWGRLKADFHLPSPAHLARSPFQHATSWRVILLNVLAVALWTVGVFAPLYAGYLNPDLRLTASMLSSIINGVATILMFVFIDPPLSIMTDDVIEGRTPEPSFRRAVVWLVGSRFAGTLLAQAFLVPAAYLIAYVARWV